jgi:hypothetical protein
MSPSLRIARLESSQLSSLGGESTETFLRYNDLNRIIRRHLPPVTASLLAQPRAVEGSEIVEWYSDLSGRPIRLSDLAGSQQDAARRLLQDRSASILRLADELPRIEPQSAHYAESLRQAVSYPGDDYVYVIEGQPVLAFWGHSRDPKASITPLAGGGGFRSLFPWLAGLAAVFLLVVLLWWLWPREEPDLLATAPVPQEPPVRDVTPEVPPIPQSAESVIDGPVPATQYCPEEKIVSPPLVVVYDNSASMAFPLNMPDDEVDLIYERYNTKAAAHMEVAQVEVFLSLLSGRASQSKQGTEFPDVTEWVAKNYPSKIRQYGPQRVHVAKPLVEKLITEIPPETQLGLVVYSGCDSIIRKLAGQGAAGRARLKQLVHNLAPDGSTPIAASLQQAGSMLNGTSKKNPGLIVLITDGVEHCEGDPCAVARAIKKAKPWIAVHVVKMGPESSSVCVAEATGGRVYQPSSVDELAKSINEAKITAPFELGCKQ